MWESWSNSSALLVADKASSTKLYPIFSKFQKRSTGKNPIKSNRNITELEKHDIWEEKRKNRINWSSAKRSKSKGHDEILQIYESLLQRKGIISSPCPQLSEETERFKKQRSRKTLLYWVEWGHREKIKEKHQVKIAKGEKSQWVNTKDCMRNEQFPQTTATQLPSERQLHSSFSLTSSPVSSLLSRSSTVLQKKKKLNRCIVSSLSAKHSTQNENTNKLHTNCNLQGWNVLKKKNQPPTNSKPQVLKYLFRKHITGTFFCWYKDPAISWHHKQTRTWQQKDTWTIPSVLWILIFSLSLEEK